MQFRQTPLLVPAGLFVFGSVLCANPSWEDAPAFSASPSDLIRASGQWPTQVGESVQELLEEFRVSLDEAGRRTVRYRYIFRIDQDSAIEHWSTVAASYTPWLEEKPLIKARVIAPDGKEYPLDPATIGEFSPEQQSPELFTDRKHLKAPLPKLAKGAIAEVEIMQREHRAFSRSGAMGYYMLSQPVPVHRTRFFLDVPTSAALKWKLIGLSGQQVRTNTRDGRTWLQLTLGPAPARKKDEPHQAPDQNPAPAICFSTTPTWGHVAAEYGQIVEAQLKGVQLKSWVQEAMGEAKDRLEIIKRLLVKLHKDVRYTGLEFGEASIVPRTPEETLKRGYGDCKDKSSLLLALLREVGIPAHLALLRAGSVRDVETDMPGLSAFDHVIVYIPGPPALWIDPTVPEAPVGELPVSDLERQTLVVSVSCKGLLQIPGTTSKRNVLRETREVFLAEAGPARILETTEAQGPSEVQLRGEYRGADAKRVRDAIKDYTERIYKAKGLGRLEYHGPEDMNKPFRLVLEAQKTGIANTGTLDAAVAVNAWPLLDKLNNYLKQELEDTEEEQESAKAKETAKASGAVSRKTDLMLGAPYALETKWIINPPLGYSHETLPENQTLTFGPAKLTLAYQGTSQGTVEADFRLDCHKRRWSPKEVEQARTALTAFGESQIPMIVFQQVGEAHLGAGKIKEALEVFRKQQAASPMKADPLIRLARAQLAAGLVETAQETLKQAIRLDASSSDAFQVQGWALQHDRVGRRMKPGWNRQGAIESYRRSIALDPKNRLARQNLAILLEHDAEGERYLPGPDLDEAVRLYKGLIEEEKEDALQDNLMVSYAKSGHFAEAQEVARNREDSPRRNAWLVGLEACMYGTEKAKALGRSQFPDLAARRTVYLGAGDVAVLFRKYAEGAALLNEGAAGAPNMLQVKARAEALAKVRPFEKIQFDLKDPRDVLRSLLLALGEPTLTAERLKNLVCEATLTPSFLNAVHARQQAFAEGVKAGGLPTAVIQDIALSLSEVTATGDDQNGYIVQTQVQGMTDLRYFVIRSGQTCRLVGSEASDLARLSLWHAQRGELPLARIWMDRLLEDGRKPDADDPLSGNIIHRLWEKGRAGTEEEIRLAALCLLAVEKEGKEAYEALLSRWKNNLPERLQGPVTQAITIGAETHKDRVRLDQASAKLLALFPDSRFAQELRVHGLVLAGNRKLALETVETALAKKTDDSNLRSIRLELLNQLGQATLAESLMAEEMLRGRAQPTDFNNYAWWQLVRGKTDEKTLDYARKAIQGDGASSYASHHTLATVLAESGRTAESLEFLHKSFDMRPEKYPIAADWYLLGRLAEQLGETAAAESYYHRVDKNEDETKDSEGNCYNLARRRLEALKLGKARGNSKEAGA